MIPTTETSQTEAPAQVADASQSRGKLQQAWRILGLLFQSKVSKVGWGMVLAIVLMVVFGPVFVTYPPYKVAPLIANSAPSLSHIFGTDYLGRDVAADLFYGGQTSMVAGLLAAGGAALIGLIVGVFSGYFSKLDGTLNGLTNIIMVFPPVPLLVLLGTIRPASLATIVFIVAVVLWPATARSIRSQVQAIKKFPYVESAKMSGMGDLEIVFKVVIPQIASIAFAYFVLLVSASLLIIVGLQYVGVGNPDAISWGSMIYWSQQFGFYTGSWWWILAPGLSVTLLTLGFGLVGYSIEETMNPRLRNE